MGSLGGAPRVGFVDEFDYLDGNST